MYSQHDEEKYILEAVKDIPDGTFLDIGAFDGRTFSNSYALAEKGWRGVLIEPSAGPFKALMKTMKDNDRASLINAAVAPEGTGLVKLWQTDDMVSTIDEDHKKLWQDAIKTNPYQLTYAPTISYRQIITSQALPYGQFDFVNLDAEGSANWGIFLDMMKWDQSIRRAMCIEFDSKKDEMLRLAMSKGFDLVHTTEENMIFVRR